MSEDKRWLRVEIGTGLQRLLLLRLKDAPPAETIGLTGEVWLEAVSTMNIAWDESLDAVRIREAFTRMSQVCEEWPAPKKLFELMPKRPQPKELPPGPVTREEAQEILRTLGLTKSFIGSKIAQRKIQEEKEAKEKHQRWVEFIEQQKQKALNLYNLTKGQADA